MTMPLSPPRRSELRAEAHNLHPVVIIGDKGLTEAVLAEIDRSLKAHELIKVRATTDDREARDAWLAEICERLEAHSGAADREGARDLPRESGQENRLSPKPRNGAEARLRGGDPAPKTRARVG